MAKTNPVPFVEPNEIAFIGPLTRNIDKVVSLTNSSANKLLFKMKSKTPERYNVKPNHGFVEPWKNKKITITALAGKDGQHHSDCWLLIEYTYVKASKSIPDLKVEFDSCQNNLENLKVRCKFMGEEDSLQCDIAESHSNGTGRQLDDVQWDFQHRYEALSAQMVTKNEECNNMKEIIEQLKRDKSDLVDNIKGMEATVQNHKLRMASLEEENRLLKQKELESVNYDKREMTTDTFEIKAMADAVRKMTAETDESDTNSEFSLDPNLTCPKCGKQFRANQLIHAKRHLEQCRCSEYD